MWETVAELELADWRRRVHELYAAVRTRAPRDAWDLWRSERERLFLAHSQSPLPAGRRGPSHVPVYFEYDPAWRRSGRIEAAARSRITLPGSGAHGVEAERIALVHVDGLAPLSLYWLLDYAGGLFLGVRDAGAGVDTYGGGRYLFDSAKGADLGGSGDELVVDLNFAYQPSCSYDPRWECPLPPRDNWIDIAVPAGERWRRDSDGER